MSKLLAIFGLVAALGLSTPVLMADHGDKDKHHGNKHDDRDDDQGGNDVTDMNIGPTVIATSGLPDGIAARKPAGEIAGYLLAKPRNTVAGPTFIRGVRTTTTRTR